MRYQRIITRGILATGLIALALTVVPAQQGPQGFGDGHRGPSPEFMLEMMAGKLELSPEQQAAVREIFTAHQAAMQDLQKQMRTARGAVKQQVDAELFDEAAIRQAALAAGEVGADMAVSRATFQQNLRNELTPEQWEEWQALHARFDGAMGHHGREFGGPGPGRRGSR